jgi:2-C-methyl-D-erythritol 2,4-cyclodiphosphate synthase
MDAPLPYRIGLGYDLHRLAPHEADSFGGETSDKPLVLGGVQLEHDHGPVSHSDGDAVLHAVTDAILGAICEPDIGQLFPDSDPVNAGRDSVDFVNEAVRRMRGAGYAVGNVDITVVMERPKLGPRKAEMAECLADLLGVPIDRVNLKGKTHERVDAIGEGRAVETHAVVLLVRGDAAGDDG